jgi:penicillin-binding protein 1A
LAQSSYLAGIIRAPELYESSPKLALERRNMVLGVMKQLGYISAKQLKTTSTKPLGIKSSTAPPVQAAYFVEYIRRLLRAPVAEGGFGLTDDQVMGGGLRVYTTLDLSMQRAAEDAVKQVLNRKDDPEVGMVAMTTDGQVRAMVGGREFSSIARARGFNFATQEAPGGGRPVGSTFKPFTLAAFLREGYSVKSTFDGPRRITIHDDRCNGPDGPWQPSNYDNEGYGRMTVLEATEKSVNTVYAQVVAKTGPDEALKAARDAGITSALSPVCSITLGVFGVTPLEMARAYSTFAAQGMRPDVVAVTKIVTPDGTAIATRAPHTVRTFDPHIADEVNGVLQKVVTDGTGRPAKIDRPSAGKTGTTEQHRDVWYVGYTPDPGLTAAVWIGYPPDKHGNIKAMTTLHGLPATGGYFAGSIWRYFMQRATAELPVMHFADVTFDGKIIGGYFRFRYRYRSSITLTSPLPTTSPCKHHCH